MYLINFYWQSDRSPSIISARHVCWRWTKSCWSSRTEIWARSFKMQQWDRRTLRPPLPPAKPNSTTDCGFCLSSGSVCTLTGLPCWHYLTGKTDQRSVSVCQTLLPLNVRCYIFECCLPAQIPIHATCNYKAAIVYQGFDLTLIFSCT